jgi:hypothetical protein
MIFPVLTYLLAFGRIGIGIVIATLPAMMPVADRAVVSACGISPIFSSYSHAQNVLLCCQSVCAANTRPVKDSILCVYSRFFIWQHTWFINPRLS